MWLKLSAHLDALRTAPRAYLTALWWHLCRKRLRARAQFAPLLGRSSKAYELWLSREERFAHTGNTALAEPPIIALVDVGAGQEGLEETLHSLSAEGMQALMVAIWDTPTFGDVVQHIDWSEKPWLMPLAPGDRLAPGAVAAYRAAVVEATGIGGRIVYADDDLLDETGKRCVPHFKPDWNGELFHYFDYLSGACILRTTPEDLEALGDSSDWARQLTASVVAKGTPLHLRRMLHHRRSRPHSGRAPPLDLTALKLPPLTVIVPTRNRVDLLEKCLKGLAATYYPDIEVIIVDNDSDDPRTLSFLAGLDPARYQVLRHKGKFNFSAINNRAVREARGELLCFLNNDIEVIEPGWLVTMAAQALREDVGAVGAQLLYPDGRIQHAGVVLGVGGGAAHAHRLLRPEEEGYFRRHALPQFVSAVTAACLVVARERFLTVGGFDEQNFPVAFNDVDLCMRLNRRGWQALYEPRATLVHHESVSRGLDRDPIGATRLAKELAMLKELWGTGDGMDPFHHPQLSLSSEHFVVRL